MTYKITPLLLLISILFACGQSGIDINKEEYGNDWPFTVESGRINCISGSAVIFSSEGQDYGLNGAARQMNYSSINPIWRDDPANPGAKVSIHGVIKQAITLCN